MSLTHALSSNVVKAGASTGAVAAIQTTAAGTIVVEPWIYTFMAAALGLIGVYLARLVTIDAENKRLGRVQTFRETGPLTWIGVLIVCPFIWHFNIAIPWASMIGLGVGYSVRVVLKIFGGGAVDAARAIARRAAGALDDEAAAPLTPAGKRLDESGVGRAGGGVLPPDKPDPGIDTLVDRLDDE